MLSSDIAIVRVCKLKQFTVYDLRRRQTERQPLLVHFSLTAQTQIQISGTSTTYAHTIAMRVSPPSSSSTVEFNEQFVCCQIVPKKMRFLAFRVECIYYNSRSTLHSSNASAAITRRTTLKCDLSTWPISCIFIMRKMRYARTPVHETIRTIDERPNSFVSIRCVVQHFFPVIRSIQHMRPNEWFESPQMDSDF